MEAAVEHLTLSLLALWPPFTQRCFPLNRLSFLTLHSSVCVHSVLTWISGCLLDTQSSHVLRFLLSLPSTVLKNVSTSSSSSGSHKAWGTKTLMIQANHLFHPKTNPKFCKHPVNTFLFFFFAVQLAVVTPEMGPGMFSSKTTTAAFTNNAV